MLGGIMSSFLMGCYDPNSKKWCTVTKCSGGYDDAMLARLQKELDVVKISKVGVDKTSPGGGNSLTARPHSSSFDAGPQQDPRLAENRQELLPGFPHPQSRGVRPA